MDYRTRSKISTAMLYRNLPERIRTQILNGGKTMTPAEQAAATEMRRSTPGPDSMAQIKRTCQLLCVNDISGIQMLS